MNFLQVYRAMQSRRCETAQNTASGRNECAQQIEGTAAKSIHRLENRVFYVCVLLQEIVRRKKARWDVLTSRRDFAQYAESEASQHQRTEGSDES